MSTADDFHVVSNELPRDRWGRPLITPPEGGEPVAYQRVTTFVGALEDTYHLSLWSQRMVALGMAGRRDLVLAASAISDPKNASQKRTLNDIVKQAKDAAQGSAAATTGTALHSFTERIDRNEPLGNVPEEYEADLTAYAAVIKPFTIVAVEGFCVRDDLRVGGSYDRVLGLPDGGLITPDGDVLTGNVIGDLKTGEHVELGMGKIACQLGVYANSEDYDHTLGSRTPLPGPVSKKWGIVIHLPAGSGKARLLWVDIAAGWETARTITPAVHAWRKRKDLSYPFASASASVASAPSLVEQIRTAPSREVLVQLHTEHRLIWTAGLTSLAKTRIGELEAAESLPSLGSPRSGG